MALMPVSPLAAAADAYRAACLAEADALTAFGEASGPAFTPALRAFQAAADATTAARRALLDVALGEPVWSNPSPDARAAGAMPVRIS